MQRNKPQQRLMPITRDNAEIDIVSAQLLTDSAILLSVEKLIHLVTSKHINLNTYRNITTENGILHEIINIPDNENSNIERKKYTCIVMLMNDYNLDVNGINKLGQTILMLACMFGYTSIIKYLLARPEIDINIPDTLGRNSMHYAIIGYSITLNQELSFVNNIKLHDNENYIYIYTSHHKTIIDDIAEYQPIQYYTRISKKSCTMMLDTPVDLMKQDQYNNTPFDYVMIAANLPLFNFINDQSIYLLQSINFDRYININEEFTNSNILTTANNYSKFLNMFDRFKQSLMAIFCNNLVDFQENIVRNLKEYLINPVVLQNISITDIRDFNMSLYMEFMKSPRNYIKLQYLTDSTINDAALNNIVLSIIKMSILVQNFDTIVKFVKSVNTSTVINSRTLVDRLKNITNYDEFVNFMYTSMFGDFNFGEIKIGQRVVQAEDTSITNRIEMNLNTEFVYDQENILTTLRYSFSYSNSEKNENITRESLMTINGLRELFLSIFVKNEYCVESNTQTINNISVVYDYSKILDEYKPSTLVSNIITNILSKTANEKILCLDKLNMVVPITRLYITNINYNNGIVSMDYMKLLTSQYKKYGNILINQQQI